MAAETTGCPGVHGEAAAQPTAQGDVVSLGCENGPVVYRDGAFHKVTVAEGYQRSGNQFGSHDSPIVLADYKTDADAEQERPAPTRSAPWIWARPTGSAPSREGPGARPWC